MIKNNFSDHYSRYVSLVFTMLLVLFTLVGCGGSDNTANGAHSEASKTSSPDIGYGSGSGSGPQNPEFQDKPSLTSTSNSKSSIQTGHKIIQTGQITLETVKFDETISGIQNYVTSIGGYIQSSSVQGKGINTNNTPSKRIGTFVLRVPQSKHSEFFTSVTDYGSITYQESKGEDVTEQYFDTEARLKSLITQEERILAMLKKTDKLSDIIELERRLSDIRYQIDSLTGTLKKWDNLVSFSTITLQIQEVEEITKVTTKKSEGLFKRISSGFINSAKQLGILLQGILVFIFTILPFLILTIIVGLVVLPIIKKHRLKDINNKSTSNSSDNLKAPNNLEGTNSEISNSNNSTINNSDLSNSDLNNTDISNKDSENSN